MTWTEFKGGHLVVRRKLGKIRLSRKKVEGDDGQWWTFICYHCQERGRRGGALGLNCYGTSIFSYRTAALAYDALVLVHAPRHALNLERVELGKTYRLTVEGQ